MKFFFNFSGGISFNWKKSLNDMLVYLTVVMLATVRESLHLPLRVYFVGGDRYF